MSWHMEVCGTKEDAIAAIDECVAAPSGMPPSVGEYLKDAVNAVRTSDAMLVHVKSVGHRPMESSGSEETSTVRAIRAKPWKPAQP